MLAGTPSQERPANARHQRMSRELAQLVASRLLREANTVDHCWSTRGINAMRTGSFWERRRWTSFTRDQRLEPIKEQLHPLLSCIAGEFFKYPPCNDALPVCHRVDMVDFKANTGVCTHHPQFQSLRRMPINALPIVDIANRDDVDLSLAVATNSSNRFEVQNLIDLVLA